MTNGGLEPFLLASASPRRRELLTSLGVSFTVLPSHAPETIAPGASPEAAALAIAHAKALAVQALWPRGTVIAGDTVVALGQEIFGKPTDRAHAERMLERLSGTTHRVISAVVLLHMPTRMLVSGVDTTYVTMRSMSAPEIAAYVASGEADDKAGAYAIQETGDRFVMRREGAFDTVVGFPCALFLRLREQLARRLAHR